MSYDAIAQHLASRKSLRIFNMQVDPEDATKFHIIPEDFDDVEQAAGAALLCRLENPLSGVGNTLDISPTIVNSTPLLDIPIILGGEELPSNSIHAFELMDDGLGGLECHLISMFEMFSLAEAIGAIQELGLTLVKEAANPVGLEVDYELIAKDGIKVQSDKKTILSNAVHITPTTKVYLDIGEDSTDAGFFLTTETVTALIDDLITGQLESLIIRDERTPQEYEFQENVSLPNGTIYYQLNAVVEEE